MTTVYEHPLKKVKNREKIFQDRNSILTDILKNEHCQIIKNFFYSLLVVLILKDMVLFSTGTKSPSFGIKMLVKGFGKLNLGIILWIVMFITHLSVFPIFQIWTYSRRELSGIPSFKRTWDVLALGLLITYYLGVLYYIPLVTYKIDLGFLTSMVIQLENLRFIMKCHSFIRNNVPGIVNHKFHSDQTSNFPKFSNYLYFSFAPTFLYRNVYPRRQNKDIRFAMNCVIDFISAVWLLGFLTDELLPRFHQDAGLVRISWINVIVSVFDIFAAGLFLFLCIFYIVFECWLNFMAEMLKFGDRKFYSEWWAATDFGVFFRTWNLVVQDWLYLYVYNDFKDNVTPNHKSMPKVMVLLISSLVHEYVLSSVLKQFFPVMFVTFFLVGAPLSFLNFKQSFSNIGFIAGLGIWTSAIIRFSVLEYNFKINCPGSVNNTDFQYVPRAVTVDCYRMH